jgi:glycerol-3-phosphate dehydrogenase (NAD(P)+)
MKIACLGTGSWGFCLAYLLAGKGFDTVSWTTKAALAHQLKEKREHPFFPGLTAPPNMHFTTDITAVLDKADLIMESVTSAGIRPVFAKLAENGCPRIPIVITSKGIEQNTGLVLPDVILEVIGEEYKPFIGCVSGPSFAQDVVKGLPTSVVASSYSSEVMSFVCDTFTTPVFRVYPNSDLRGVAFGGALKNIIAIACGISDGLALGSSSRAALMTRGLHEIRKLAVSCGCFADTLNGLSGMGDFVLTCNSIMSRNFKFGYLLAQGMSTQEAQTNIGMVVEGAYTCVSALQLSKKNDIPMPISETVFKIIYEAMPPMEAVKALMQRTIKEEHL